jgi:pimeloyl-ACP methyl ester carboxylesterase
VTTFVLVPGSHHGGWSFEPLTRGLRAAGHDVYPVTLTGVGDRNHLISADVNLQTHITDVAAVFDGEQISDAVLCGHSYGGMVISGLADLRPDRVRALVYLDAFVPADGDSAWTLTSDAERDRILSGVRADGFSFPPQPFFDPRATSHPVASFLQGIRLTGKLDSISRREYVYAAGWAEGPFGPVAERLRHDSAWNVHTLESGHNLMRDVPAELFRIVAGAGAR